MKSLQNSNEQDEDDDEDNYGGDLLVVVGAAGDTAEGSRGAVETGLVAVDGGVDVVEHGDVAVELVANLQAELALAADGGAEAVEVLVLLVEDLGVVVVDLLVGEGLGLIAVARRSGGGGVIMVGAEELAALGVEVGVGVDAWRGRGVAEADRLARFAGLRAGRLAGGGGAGGVGKVWGERRRVGAGQSVCGGWVGEAVELRGEVVELLLEGGQGVGDGGGGAAGVNMSVLDGRDLFLMVTLDGLLLTSRRWRLLDGSAPGGEWPGRSGTDQGSARCGRPEHHLGGLRCRRRGVESVPAGAQEGRA